MNIDRKLQFVSEIDKLKSIVRVNKLHNGQRRENTAEHSWHLALMTLVFLEDAEEEIDALTAMKMALLHDIVEIDAGDTYAFDEKGYEDKFERELKAAKRIFSILPQELAEEYLNLWLEFEKGESPEAKFVLAMDRLAPVLSHFGNNGLVWKERDMSKEKLLTRADAIRDYAPKVWPQIESMIDKAISSGILKN